MPSPSRTVAYIGCVTLLTLAQISGELMNEYDNGEMKGLEPGNEVLPGQEMKNGEGARLEKMSEAYAYETECMKRKGLSKVQVDLECKKMMDKMHGDLMTLIIAQRNKIAANPEEINRVNEFFSRADSCCRIEVCEKEPNPRIAPEGLKTKANCNDLENVKEDIKNVLKKSMKQQTPNQQSLSEHELQQEAMFKKIHSECFQKQDFSNVDMDQLIKDCSAKKEKQLKKLDRSGAYRPNSIEAKVFKEKFLSRVRLCCFTEICELEPNTISLPDYMKVDTRHCDDIEKMDEELHNEGMRVVQGIENSGTMGGSGIGSSVFSVLQVNSKKLKRLVKMSESYTTDCMSRKGGEKLSFDLITCMDKRHGDEGYGAMMLLQQMLHTMTMSQEENIEANREEMARVQEFLLRAGSCCYIEVCEKEPHSIIATKALKANVSCTDLEHVKKGIKTILTKSMKMSKQLHLSMLVWQQLKKIKSQCSRRKVISNYALYQLLEKCSEKQFQKLNEAANKADNAEAQVLLAKLLDNVSLCCVAEVCDPNELSYPDSLKAKMKICKHMKKINVEVENEALKFRPEHEFGSMDNPGNENALKKSTKVPSERAGRMQGSRNENVLKKSISTSGKHAERPKNSGYESTLEESTKVPSERAGRMQGSRNENVLKKSISTPGKHAGRPKSSGYESTLEGSPKVPSERAGRMQGSRNENVLKKSISTSEKHAGRPKSSGYESTLEESTKMPSERAGRMQGSRNENVLKKSISTPGEHAGRPKSSGYESTVEESTKVPSERGGRMKGSRNENILKKSKRLEKMSESYMRECMSKKAVSKFRADVTTCIEKEHGDLKKLMAKQGQDIEANPHKTARFQEFLLRAVSCCYIKVCEKEPKSHIASKEFKMAANCAGVQQVKKEIEESGMMHGLGMGNRRLQGQQAPNEKLRRLGKMSEFYATECKSKKGDPKFQANVDTCVEKGQVNLKKRMLNQRKNIETNPEKITEFASRAVSCCYIEVCEKEPKSHIASKEFKMAANCTGLKQEVEDSFKKAGSHSIQISFIPALLILGALVGTVDLE